MKFFSMFSGIGGFDLALTRHGHECVGFSEIDKHAIKIYERHFPGVKNYGDATKINTAELPDFGLLCAGFPCQPFSIAGKRGGFKDTRGTLFFEIARICRDKRPKIILLENVKGLLSHDSGRTFGTILYTLGELGYWWEYEVLNSKNFGVPQNRERVFIIGHLAGECSRPVFPLGKSNEVHYEGEGMEQQAEARITPKIIVVGNSVPSEHEAGNIYSPEGIAPTVRQNHGEVIKIVVPVMTPNRMKTRQEGRRFKENGEPSFTLTAQDRHGVFLGDRIRKLTEVECERLQGFPDGWTEGISSIQRYKCLGNAVTVNVVEAIVEKMDKMVKE
ncbi:MAG: DNA (cytosine-5-)-methyltransferase [Candidatus Anstonellales archaeon]